MYYLLTRETSEGVFRLPCIGFYSPSRIFRWVGTQIQFGNLPEPTLETPYKLERKDVGTDHPADSPCSDSPVA